MRKRRIKKTYGKLGLLFIILLISLASISMSYAAWYDTIYIDGTISTGEWSATIGDFVWHDIDDDGIQDTGELGVPGVTVNLYKDDDTLFDTTTTNASGGYLFTNVETSCDDGGETDCYYVEFILPLGYVFSKLDQGSDDAFDSDADPISGKTIDICVDMGDVDLTWDAGLVECSPCDGKITQLTLQYNGGSTAYVQVEQKKDGDMIFEGYVDPGEQFTFDGTYNKSGKVTMWTEIIVYVEYVEHVRIHTSCSAPIGPGIVFGDFEVIRGYSLNGGLLCPECDEC